MDKGLVTDHIDYLTADEEDRFVIAQANATMNDKGELTEDRVLVRVSHGDVDLVPADEVDYIDVSARQMVSVGSASSRSSSTMTPREPDGCEHAAPGRSAGAQ